MIEDLKKVYAGQHASNLGGFPAKDIKQSIKSPAFIVDPVVVDELAPLAHFTGLLP
jgi:butyrate kinase